MKILDWKTPLRTLINTLVSHGLTPVSIDDGEETIITRSEDEIIYHASEVDESTLTVEDPNGRELGLFIVFGNEPYELVVNHTCHELLDKACDEFQNKWEGRSCPVIEI